MSKPSSEAQGLVEFYEALARAHNVTDINLAAGILLTSNTKTSKHKRGGMLAVAAIVVLLSLFLGAHMTDSVDESVHFVGVALG